MHKSYPGKEDYHVVRVSDRRFLIAKVGIGLLNAVAECKSLAAASSLVKTLNGAEKRPEQVVADLIRMRR